jgi:6-phosphogluconolactonase
MRFHRYPDGNAAGEACAAHILGRLQGALSTNPRAYLAVSGGSSPRRMFETLRGAKFPWDHVQVFWVDERVVPPTDPQSNFKLASDHWLGPANFPSGNIHRIQAELGAEEAARRYIEEIRTVFELAPGQMPRFDVIHRGIGPEAHTASLFPGEPLIADRSGLAAAVWVEKMKSWRVTLLPGVLEAARNTAMLVISAEVAEAVRHTLEGEYRPSEFPAQIASRGTEADWFVSAEAAADFDG